MTKDEYPKLEYDPDADAAYIRFSDLPYAYGVDLDHERRVDYAENREPMGVEILCVSSGVETEGLPHRRDVERLLDQNGIKAYA